MSDKKRALLEAYRAHVDLGEDAEQVLEAWDGATQEEKEELFDRLLMDALLVDAFRKSAVDRGQGGRQHEAGRRPLREFLVRREALAIAAALMVAVGVGLYLWQSRLRYPQPRAGGSFHMQPVAGRPASGRGMLRGQRITARPGGATLSLGGYCEVDLDPDTTVIVRGKPREEVIDLRDGRLLCRVTPDRGELTVTTPRGSLQVVGTEFETTVEHYARKGENAMHRSRTSAIVTATVVSGIVAYHFGDMTGFLSGGMGKAFAGEGAKKIAAGKPTYNPKTHPAWEGKGRLVGRVRDCPGCEVKALDAESKKVVKSCSVKRWGKVYELEMLSPGKYVLLVTADGYEALDVHNLVVKAKNDLRVDIEFEGGGQAAKQGGSQAKNIAAGRPTYRAKSHRAWRSEGRIVGRVRDCPGCEVKALDAESKKTVKSHSVKPGGKSYELQWLKPGEYTLLVTADGYEVLDVHDLVVKAKNDLHVNIEF